MQNGERSFGVGSVNLRESPCLYRSEKLILSSQRYFEMSQHGHAIKTFDELNTIAGKNKAIFVDFHATWCGPCKAIAPFVNKRCNETGITLVTVDVDQAEDVAAAFKVSAMPTFKVLDRNGVELGGVVGGSQVNVEKMVQLAVNHSE